MSAIVGPVDDGTLATWRTDLLEVVMRKGYERRDEPFELSSGELSHDFVDGKRALAGGSDLALACRYIVELARRAEVHFDAAGGLTMGADQFAHGIAVLGPVQTMKRVGAPGIGMLE